MTLRNNHNPSVPSIKDESSGRIMLIYTQRPGSGGLYQLTEPLGLNSLAAFVEAKGYGASVFSGPLNEAVKAVEHELYHKGLSALGLYCDYENRSAVESFCRKAKEVWKLRVFVGGPQAIVLDEEFLKTSLCDAVVRSEGEYPLFELLEYFIHGRGSIDQIAGVSFLDDKGRMVALPPRAPIPDLDQLPIRIPETDPASIRTKGSLSILSGRGCPFHCAFCYEGSVPGKVRLRSVEHVMTEIRQALHYNPEIKFIWFADDTFTLDYRRIESFCRELKQLQADYDFVWFCECHPSTLIKWPEMLHMMLDAGLVRMQIGIESGAGSVLQLYRKQATLEQIESVVSFSMEAGLPHLAGNIIIGGASETRSTFNESKNFATRLLELGPGMVDITSTFFLPLPKTAISCNPSDFGLIILDEHSLTSRGDVPVVETEELSREQISAMRLEFTTHVHQTMHRLYQEGKIPEQRIINEFNLKDNYGLTSDWYNLVYVPENVSKKYFFQGERNPVELVSEAHGLDRSDSFFPLASNPAETKNAKKFIDDLRGSLAQFPDLKFVHIPDYDFLKDEKRSSQISRALGELKRERDFVWCCNCTAGTLVRSSTLVREMAANGLVRIEMPVDFVSPGTPGSRSDKLNKANVKNAVALCGWSGVAQVAGRLVMQELPSDLEELHRVMAWVDTLLEAAPGKFECNLELLLPVVNDPESDGRGVCVTEPEKRKVIDKCVSCPDVLHAPKHQSPEFIQKEFSHHINESMRKLLSNKRISRTTLLSHFVLYTKYGVESAWLKNLFPQYGILFRYFSLIADNGVCDSSSIGAEQLDQWRPLRTMDLWLVLDFSRGEPRIGRYVLSPLEYEILLYASGKLTLSQLLPKVYAKFGNRFEDYADYRETVMSRLQYFEDNYWLVYSEI